jgi:hypothetical protein
MAVRKNFLISIWGSGRSRVARVERDLITVDVAMRCLLMILLLLPYCAAWSPSAAGLQFRAHAPHATAVITMAPNPNKRKLPNPTEEQLSKTIRNTAIANVVGLAIIVGIPLLGGKEFSQENAPGYAEAKATRDAGKQAYIASENARREMLAARSAAARATGQSQTAPPKPWEKGGAWKADE